MAHRLITDGSLSAEPPDGDQPPDRYAYDPADAPHNAMSFEQMKGWEDVQSFPYNVRQIETRHDVVTYTSAESVTRFSAG